MSRRERVCYTTKRERERERERDSAKIWNDLSPLSLSPVYALLLLAPKNEKKRRKENERTNKLSFDGNIK
jgi:hypothetical protein